MNTWDFQPIQLNVSKNLPWYVSHNSHNEHKYCKLPFILFNPYNIFGLEWHMNF